MLVAIPGNGNLTKYSIKITIWSLCVAACTAIHRFIKLIVQTSVVQTSYYPMFMAIYGICPSCSTLTNLEFVVIIKILIFVRLKRAKPFPGMENVCRRNNCWSHCRGSGQMTFFAAKFPPKRIIQTIHFLFSSEGGGGGGGGSHLTAGPIKDRLHWRNFTGDFALSLHIY